MFIVLYSFYLSCYLSLFPHFTPTYLFDPMNRVFRFCSWAPRCWASVWSLRQLPLPSVPLAFSPALQHLRRGECNTRRAQQATAAKQRDREREREEERGKLIWQQTKCNMPILMLFWCTMHAAANRSHRVEQVERGKESMADIWLKFCHTRLYLFPFPYYMLHVACCASAAIHARWCCLFITTICIIIS